MPGFTYIASPYSDPDPSERQWRYIQALEYVNYCLARRDWVYSPIVHCHAVTVQGVPFDADFWAEYDMTMMDRSSGIRVLKIEGWDASLGVKSEIEWAHRNGRPVDYVDVIDDPIDGIRYRLR